MPCERDGSLGIVYACGARSNGHLQVQEYLKGKKIKGIYGQEEETFVALVDKWELAWEKEPQKVMEGLKSIKIQQIALGETHRLALSLDGEIYSWGTEAITTSQVIQGPLGQVWITGKAKLIKSSSKIPPHTPQSPSASDELVQELSLEEKEPKFITPKRIHTSNGELFFTCLAAGKNHSAAITKDGDLYTWGRNVEGQCGQDLRQGISPIPRYVDFFFHSKQRVHQVACGDQFTIVLVQNGAIYSFGQVTSSRDPNGNKTRLLIEKSTQDDSVFTQIACGKSHTLAITNTGLLYTCGLNTYGQLGLKNRPNACIVPTCVDSYQAFTKVFAGGNYSAAITSNGELYTWGNGSHGKLAHGNGHLEHEFTPRKVQAFDNILISSVVCGTKTLYAFAPSNISFIYPKGGDLQGNYELRLSGSGFWASEDLTVRFVPSIGSSGLLPRGSIGEFDPATGDIVCKVPKFSLPGEFSVEVAMNGKHFTTNNHVFQVYKTPTTIQVSTRETRLEGGEKMSLRVRGAIPSTSENSPVIRFRPLKEEQHSNEWPTTRGTVTSLEMKSVDTSGDKESEEKKATAGGHDPEDHEAGLLDLSEPLDHESPPGSHDQQEPQEDGIDQESVLSLIDFQVPAFPSSWKEQDQYVTCILEISYNGKDFNSIQVSHTEEETNRSSGSTSTRKQAYQVIVHDGQVDQIVPNSFILTPGIAQDVSVHIKHLFDLQQSSVGIEYRHLDQETGALLGTAEAIVKIVDQKAALQARIPPVETWEYKQEASAPALERAWYENLSLIDTTLHVSLNGSKSLLPLGTGAKLYGYVNGNLIALEPPCGPLSGGTQVTLEGDFFKFDTQDAKVSLVFKSNEQSSEVVVPAICLNGRVTFTAPSFPFSSPEKLQNLAETNETPVAISPPSYRREEVDVKVALDGQHFADSSIRYVYYESIKMYAFSPQEVTTGTKIVVKTGSNTVSTGRACVRLRVLGSGHTVDVPAELNESSNTVEFVVPELPIGSKDYVYVSLSLNGQQFIDTIAEGPPPEPAVPTTAKGGKPPAKSVPAEALPSVQLEHLDPPYLRFFYKYPSEDTSVA